MGKVSEAIAALDAAAVIEAVQDEIDAGRDPMELIDEARVGLQQVGERFDAGEYYLIELIRASQVFQEAARLINPKLVEAYGTGESRGRVLIGTVAGDIHDLGKSIVKVLLDCRGVEIRDLGVDVAPSAFVEGVREFQPDVVGMSALLTAAIPQFKTTLNALEAAGLRNGVKTIVGGGTVIDLDASALNVDHIAADANEGVGVILRWLDAAKSASATTRGV